MWEGKTLILMQVLQALCNFESRATSLLLKDLSKAGAGHRAVELFDWLRSLEEGNPLRSLCDVYTFTAMIAQCIYQQASLCSHLPCWKFPLLVIESVHQKQREAIFSGSKQSATYKSQKQGRLPSLIYGDRTV